MLDLTKPVSQHNVTSCFTKDQTGSYFNGSGYTVLMHDGYKVGSDVAVTLEFRTSQSEGVFLGISSAKVDAIGLEMKNGQVVFNVNNGAGRVSVRSTDCQQPINRHFLSSGSSQTFDPISNQDMSLSFFD
ncbi:hypothetical protein F2P81_019757 [Scophthalmus maximus]|uniref:Laminin G domain-containing protein n=1 Tax=Scophthalmus maximus TaxID=52904 RepID=A0A6A4SAH6_SCOMX|nr:hypothetical protein F2P81_019757 [Scophthalmus maximus]